MNEAGDGGGAGDVDRAAQEPVAGRAFRARALAQAHPLTHVAKRYVDRAVATQRTSQPLPEIGIWAGAGLINGYCLRRVEEIDAGIEFEPPPEDDVDLDMLDEAAATIAGDLRVGDPNEHALGDSEETLRALDRIIASEVDKRLEHWRDTIEESAWAELEEYLTWWVVKGYALRVAEVAMAAPRT